MTHVSVQIDLPGKFDSFFSGSSVGQNPDGYSHVPAVQAGADLLHAAYIDCEHRKIGKGYALRLTLAGEASLVEHAIDVLGDYTDACRVANKDTAEDRYCDAADRASARAEMAASHKVDERIQVALRQVARQVRAFG